MGTNEELVSGELLMSGCFNRSVHWACSKKPEDASSGKNDCSFNAALNEYKNTNEELDYV